jgi:uncharacterized protein YbaR (Trm112 family)
MKKDILEILCCPSCKGDLKLYIKKEEDDEILEGSFICKKCSHNYSIDDGTPNLLEK